MFHSHLFCRPLFSLGLRVSWFLLWPRGGVAILIIKLVLKKFCLTLKSCDLQGSASGLCGCKSMTHNYLVWDGACVPLIARILLCGFAFINDLDYIVESKSVKNEQVIMKWSLVMFAVKMYACCQNAYWTVCPSYFAIPAGTLTRERK